MGLNNLRLEYNLFWLGQMLHSFALKSCPALSSDPDDKQPSAETLILLPTRCFHQPRVIFTSAICHMSPGGGGWHEIWAGTRKVNVLPTGDKTNETQKKNSTLVRYVKFLKTFPPGHFRRETLYVLTPTFVLRLEIIEHELTKVTLSSFMS